MSEEVEEQGAKKTGFPFVAIAIVALFCGAGGAAGVIFVTGGPVPVEAEAAREKVGGEMVAPFGERVLQLDPFVVNVGEEGYPRYLKLNLAFEVDSPESLAELEQRVPQVRDMTILLLSSKRLTELSDFEGKAVLKEDLRDRVGALVPGGSVESVMFTEFVVQ